MRSNSVLYTWIFCTVHELRKKLGEKGFAVEDVPGDGNCMFEVLARQLTRLGNQQTHQSVRSDIVDFIRENPVVCISSKSWYASFGKPVFDSLVEKCRLRNWMIAGFNPAHGYLATIFRIRFK